MKLKPLFPLSRYQFSHCHSLAGQKARQNTKLPCKFRTWPATEVNETRYAKVKETLNEVKVHQVNPIRKTVHHVKVITVGYTPIQKKSEKLSSLYSTTPIILAKNVSYQLSEQKRIQRGQKSYHCKKRVSYNCGLYSYPRKKWETI